MANALKILTVLIISFNVFLAIIGIGILTGGILLEFDVVPGAKHSFTLLPIFVLAIGGSIVFLSFLGALSVGLRNKTLLLVYITVIIILSLVQICVGLFIMYQATCDTQLQINIDTHLHQIIGNYHNDTESRGLMDFLQQKMKCCGIDDYTDWTLENSILPNSCCAGDVAPCLPNSNVAFRKGCSEPLQNSLVLILSTTYTSALWIAVAKISAGIMALFFYLVLKSDSRRHKYQKYFPR